MKYKDISEATQTKNDKLMRKYKQLTKAIMTFDKKFKKAGNVLDFDAVAKLNEDFSDTGFFAKQFEKELKNTLEDLELF